MSCENGWGPSKIEIPGPHMHNAQENGYPGPLYYQENGDPAWSPFSQEYGDPFNFEMRDPWMTDCFQGVCRLSVWQTIITGIWNPKFCKISESSGENATITIPFGFCCGLVPRLSPSKRLGKRLVLLYVFLSVYRLLTGVGGTKRLGSLISFDTDVSMWK